MGAITLTDDLGHAVTLAGPAQHIVSMAPSNTELLFAVGAGSQVVGRDTLSDYPPQARSLADIGGSMGTFDTEAIVALHPDLVLAAEINPPDLVASLQKLGLTVYYLKNPVTLDGLYANLETVGALTGYAAAAATFVASLKARVAAVDAKVATATTRPSVYYELDGTDPTKTLYQWRRHIRRSVDPIKRVGSISLRSSIPPGRRSAWEQLLVDNPQIILLGDSATARRPTR